MVVMTTRVVAVTGSRPLIVSVLVIMVVALLATFGVCVSHVGSYAPAAVTVPSVRKPAISPTRSP